MKKFIALSSKEALLIQNALTKVSLILSFKLNHPEEELINDVYSDVLDELDLCDSLRLRISKVFPDLSNID